MRGKKTEISREKRKKMFAFFVAVVLLLIFLSAILYYVLNEKMVGLVLFVIGTVGPIISLLVSLFVSDIWEWIVRWKIWSNPNLRWYIRVIVIIDIISFGFLIFKIISSRDDKLGTTLQQERYNDSIEAVKQQQQYNDLVANYEKRMEQRPFFEDAYELLVDDSIMLVQITQMLDENPNLKVDTTDYSKQFENRAGDAIESINYAIFYLGLPHDDSLKYTKQKKDIEKMIINIKKM